MCIVLSRGKDVAWYQGTLQRGIFQVLDVSVTLALCIDP